ncbi:50S ribosomal protein L9 [bacterium]|nr:50S ribosomal protein L9 [bacterium]
MQVLLIEDYPSIGYVGETVQVKRGYARNFLIPRGFAVDVGSRRAKEFQHLLKGVGAKRVRLKSEAEELGRRVAHDTMTFSLKVGSSGKAFGSITARDILKKLEERGYEFEKKQVRLEDSIKAPGKYTASLQLHSEVVVELTIVVEGEKGAPEAEEELIAAPGDQPSSDENADDSSEEAGGDDSEEDTEPSLES